MKPKVQPIRTRVDKNILRTVPVQCPIKVGGWLSGRGTYLRIADAEDKYLGAISGQKLYRLAKAIVRRFEATS
jgi:hypothetical protein